MTTSDENIITLSLPERNKFLPSGLTSVNKEGLYNMLATLHVILKGRSIEFTKGSAPKTVELFRRFMDLYDSRKLLRSNLETIYLALCSDFANVVALARCDRHVHDTWELLLREPLVSQTAAAAALDRKLMTEIPNYWNNNCFNEPAFFPLIITRKENDYYYYSKSTPVEYSLPPKTRKKLIEMFYGDAGLTPVIVKDLPDSKEFITENFENQIASDLMFLSGLALTGSPLTATGSLTAAKLKTIKKSFTTPGFRPYGSEYQLDRVELLVITYFDIPKPGGKEEETIVDVPFFGLSVARELCRRISGTQFGAFFPEFKGMTKASTADAHTSAFVEFINKLLKQARGSWLSLANLRTLLLCHSSTRMTADGYTPLFGSRSYTHRFEYKDPAAEKKNRGLTDFDRFDFPFLLRWLRYLCGMGILETANAGTSEEDDPFEGLRYVRLTPLGLYALGIANDYKPQALPLLGKQIEYDDASGIITLLDDNCPFMLFITQIATPISSRRYRVTVNSLLKNCSDSADLDSCIRNLKSIISLDDNPILKRMAEEASNRTDLSVPIRESYTLMQLRSNVPGLADAIRNCREIRENVILAEDGILLMEYSFQTRFRELLRQRGYLLD